ncbi:MAG: hypothetical protein FK731_11130 [Asgard group archaeon]|nr:hypothetical protein [Asgard group archaeon]
MGKDFIHSKLFKSVIIVAVSSILIIGIIVPFLTANFSSELYLRIDGKGMNRGDEKLILFVDVPDSGGKALAHAAFEVTSRGLRDNWDFFDSSIIKDHEFEVDLFAMDFVFIIASDSNGNGYWDNFYLKLTVPNSPLYENYLGYNFGNKYGNNLNAGIWLLDHSEGILSIFNSGWTVYDIHADGLSTTAFYSLFDWSGLYSYLEDYFNMGDETIVTNLISNFDFPIPATILYN